MNIKYLTPDLSVSTQITAAEVYDIAAQGFMSVICNRPDGEKAEQPAFDDIAQAGNSLGLRVAHLPVNPKTITDAEVDAFAAIVEKMPKPILAYCGTGTRATILWALSQSGSLNVDEILECAREAGYDLSALVPRLQSRG
jgi:sulfide:quinone oxidoreductase